MKISKKLPRRQVALSYRNNRVVRREDLNGVDIYDYLEVVLDKSDLADLQSTPIQIPYSSFTNVSGEVVEVEKVYTLKKRDGVDFSAGLGGVNLKNSSNETLVTMTQSQINASSDLAYKLNLSQTGYTLVAEEGLEIQGQDVTGGGSDAEIVFRIKYRTFKNENFFENY